MCATCLIYEGQIINMLVHALLVIMNYSLACSCSAAYLEMGDSSSSWNNHENGYSADDDSSPEDGSSSYENESSEESHLGGHSEQNDLGSSYSESMSEVCSWFFHGKE